MKESGFIFYFSGLETQPETTDKFLSAGKKIKGAMMSYLTFRGGKRHTDYLIRWRKEFGVKVMVDSGAHAFLYAENVESKVISSVAGGWHPINKEVEGLLKDPDKYVHEYMDWLEKNREAYDYAVELDIQKMVGQDKVDVWRDEFLARKIPIVIVLHPRAGDTVEVVRKWKAKGVEYFGRGEFTADNPADMAQLREMSGEGVKVHMFAFSPNNLSKYFDWIDSSDSSSWLAAGKLGQMVVAKGRTYEIVGVKDNPIMVHKAVNDLSAVLDKEEMEESIKARKYASLNFFSMMEMQKWLDTITHRPAYARQLATAASGETVLPTWVNDKDKLGRPKSIYLQSRFNNYRSGVYAREIQKNALECNNCVVKDVCPVFQTDALCYFTPHWQRLGAKTRNKDAIVNELADLIGQKHARLERARYFEAKLGGQTDRMVSQLENDLAKTLDLLDKVLYGNASGMKLNVLGAPGSMVQIGMNLNEALEQLRGDYGDDLTNRIRKRAIDAEAKVIADGGSES